MANNSRNSRRPGNGVHFGSLNPAVHVGNTAPSDPNDKDLWFDTTASPGTWKWYDDSTDTWKT